MDEKELQKNIALYYSKLSPRLQSVFSGVDWLQNLAQIAQKYTLTEEQTQTLGTEVMLVLLGIVNLDKFYEEINGQLSLSQDTSTKIISEIDNLILTPVRTEIIEAYDKNNDTQTNENLDKRLENIPENIKKIIMESNYKTTLYNITKEYELNVIEMGLLEDEMVGLMAGSVRPDDFEEKIKNSLKLPADKTRGLVEAINSKILKAIREKMERLSNPTTFKPEDSSDAKILSSAGIEIMGGNKILPVPQKLEINGTVKPATPTPNNPTPPKPSILEQKLSASVKTEPVKTEHSLNNLTPNKPSVDPYREIPE